MTRTRRHWFHSGLVLVALALLVPDVVPPTHGQSTDRGRRGEWSAVQDWPVIAIHAALMPNGRVVAWDSSTDDRILGWYTPQESTRVTLWDPGTNLHEWVMEDTHGMFCAGHTHLSSGKLLSIGGDHGLGVPSALASIFDGATGTWSPTTPMHRARWYPTATLLPSGDVLAVGGFPSVAEVLRKGSWRKLTGARSTTYGAFYPWVQAVPNGKVFYAGPYSELSYLDTAGTGTIEPLGERDRLHREYGSYAMYDVGKVIVAGGAFSVATSQVIDVNGAAPQVTPTGSMWTGRRQHNLTILANGEVLVTGGNSTGAPYIDLGGGVLMAEAWNPLTGKWRRLASMHVTRQYHSIALLLPDGRVLSAGGGFCCDDATAPFPSDAPINSRNAEIFSPPYLFDADGNSAPRPRIRAAPRVVEYGDTFTIEVSEAWRIRKAHLIRLGSVTHSVNMGQRLVPLSFTRSGGSLVTSAPADGGIAPPGYYMLFVVTGDGVPSVARFVRLAHPAGSS